MLPHDGRRQDLPDAPGEVCLRLARREPFAAGPLLQFLADRAVPGVEDVVDGTYRRSLRLPGGYGVVELRPEPGYVACLLRVSDPHDLSAAVARCRHLFDLEADPVAIDALLGTDPLLRPLVATQPGMRVAGHVDGGELAARAVLGQQVSVAGARTAAARLVERLGDPLPVSDGTLTHLFPSPAAVAEATDADLPMPASRRRALRAVSAAVAAGDLVIDIATDRDQLTASLVAFPGIGPWTAAYIVMRGTGDPDAFMPSDLGVRHALERLGLPADPAAASRLAERWRPWRAYAMQHLWASLSPSAPLR